MWNGTAINAGDFWTIHKQSDCRAREARCEVWTHQFGWELRLLIDGELQRSQVARSTPEWLNAAEEWKAALLAKGWE
jgi:hypothetical protein